MTTTLLESPKFQLKLHESLEIDVRSRRIEAIRPDLGSKLLILAQDYRQDRHF